MYFTTKINSQAEKSLQECKDALSQLSVYLKSGSQSELVISGQKSLYSKVPRDGSIYLIKEGALRCVKGDKVFYYVEEGDLVGFEGSAYDNEMDYFAEFAVVVTKIDPKQFLESDTNINLWNKFQGNFLNVVLQVAASTTKTEALFSPEIRNFEAGDIIVQQGSIGDEVYSLIDGIAETIVDNNVVGEVLPDQLFGAVSILTNTERMATIKALTDCMVVVLSKEQFMTLIESKPDTLIRLAEDLSRAIVALNDQVAGLVRIPG